MDWFYTYYSVLAFSLSFSSLCWVFAILIQFACVPHYWVSFCILTTVYLKGHAYSHKKNAKKQYIHLICEALRMVKRQRIVVCVCEFCCVLFFVFIVIVIVITAMLPLPLMLPSLSSFSSIPTEGVIMNSIERCFFSGQSILNEPTARTHTYHTY